MRSVILALLLCAAALAQPVNPPPSFIKGTPPGGAGGACTASSLVGYLDSSGTPYTCQNGIWTSILSSTGPAGPAGPVGPPGQSGQDGTPGIPGYSPNSITSGGQVVWTGGLHFTSSRTIYQIAGTSYTAPQANLTLTTADPSNPRIDAVVVNTSSVAVVLTGTAAATPAPPSIDPATQLSLTFVLVPAGGTAPSNVTNTLIYDENAGPSTEWTCSRSGSPIALASTVNPYHLTHDIEATSATSGNYAQCAAAAPFSPTTVNYLVLYIRSKASWPSKRALQLQWYLSTTAKGSVVTINEGAFGFSSSSTSAYQQLVIPMSLFGQIASLDTIRATVAGSTGTIGFYLDLISVQAGLPSPTAPTTMTWQGAWSAVPSYAVNSVVTLAGVPYIAVAANTNSTPTSSNANWAQLNGTAAPTGTGGPVYAASPALSGSPTAPTQISSDSSTKIATTKYVTDAVAAGGSVPASAPFLGSNSSNQLVLASPFSINPQTATYQVTAADFAGYKTITVASGTFTITLVSNTGQPPSGQYITILNYGSGVVTVARNGQNLNGGTSSITIPAGSATTPTYATVFSDASNYFAVKSAIGASGVTFDQIGAGTNVTALQLNTPGGLWINSGYFQYGQMPWAHVNDHFFTIASQIGIADNSAGCSTSGAGIFFGIGTSSGCPAGPLDVEGGTVGWGTTPTPITLVATSGTGSAGNAGVSGQTGGAMTMTAGNGTGFSANGSTGGDGGNATVTAGNGGTAPSGTNGSGGNVILQAGAVGASGSGGAPGVILFKGHLSTNGTAPAVSSCGSSPSITGNDNAGLVTIGSGVQTTCTVTFAKVYASAPVCVATDDSNVLAVRPSTSTSALTLTSLTTMGGDVISYICTQVQ